LQLRFYSKLPIVAGKVTLKGKRKEKKFFLYKLVWGLQRN